MGRGLNYAVNNTFGLAGTGLIADSGVNGQGYGFGTANGIYYGGWSGSIAAIPAAQQGYALRAGAGGDTAGATPLNNFGYVVDGATLNPSAQYNWALYTVGAPGGGQGNCV